MTNPLALSVDENERPEWVPEAVWEPLKKKLVLSRMGVCRDSLDQIADSFGLEPFRVRGLIQSRGFRVQMEEMRRRTEELSGLSAQMASEGLAEKLADPDVLAKLSPKDLSLIAKQQTDNMLNLGNGQVGASNTTFNFADLKMMVGGSVEKPTIDV